MADGFRIEVQAGQVLKRLTELRRAGQDMRPHLDAVGDHVANEVRMTFVESRDPYGRPWKPLRLRGGQPLRDTGRLMNSITHRVSGDAVEVGTNVLYAATHQFGATIRPRRARYLVFRDGQGGWMRKKQVKVPARPFLPTDGLPAEWELGTLEVLGQSILGQAGGRR